MVRYLMTLVQHSFQNLLISLLVGVVVFEFVVLFPKDLADQSNVKLYRRTEDVQQFDQIAQDLHLMEVNSEKVEWELWSSRADKRTGQDIWGLNDVNAKFFGKKENVFTVHGQNGSVSESRNQMQISGEVETISTEGYKFKTESILYDPVAHALYSPGEVEMEGPADKDGQGLRLRGSGLRAMINQRKTEIASNVYATKMVSAGKKVVIRSEQAEFSGEERVARFTGKVEINYGEMKIRGPYAEFQINPKSLGMDRLVMNKGAMLKDPDRTATAQKLVADFPTQKLTLDGNPRVVQGEDVLVGDQIIFLDAGDRVQVVNAKAKFDSNQKGIAK